MEGSDIMKQELFFENAKWVGARERKNETFSVVRGYFDLPHVCRAELNVLGLGFFKCYINGTCINPDTFLPLSTGVMIKMGYVYENLMINLKAKNVKLKGRMIRIVNDVAGCGEEEAERLLEEADWDIKKAISKWEERN
jgi:hypothetical protein